VPAFVLAIVAWLLFCWIINPALFLQDDTGHKFFFIEMSMYGCGNCAFVLAIIALACRERFSALSVSALIAVLAIAGLILAAMVMLMGHTQGQ
jgi:hypothetical protein